MRACVRARSSVTEEELIYEAYMRAAHAHLDGAPRALLAPRLRLDAPRPASAADADAALSAATAAAVAGGGLGPELLADLSGLRPARLLARARALCAEAGGDGGEAACGPGDVDRLLSPDPVAEWGEDPARPGPPPEEI